jgi:hypothetical protein
VPYPVVTSNVVTLVDVDPVAFVRDNVEKETFLISVRFRRIACNECLDEADILRREVHGGLGGNQRIEHHLRRILMLPFFVLSTTMVLTWIKAIE